MEPPLRINLTAPINSLGYGVVGLNIMKALDEAGVEVALFPIGATPHEMMAEYGDLIRKCRRAAAFYDGGAPCLRVYHQNEMGERIGTGRFAGYPFFELTKLGAGEVHHLNGLDLLFLPSEWAKEVALKNGVTSRIEVLCPGVDRSIFHEGLPDNPMLADHTVFLNVGKWEKRKGHDILVDVFNKAFGPDERVLLLMLCANPFIGQDNLRWKALYEESPMGRAGKISVLDRLGSQHDVARLMGQADCGVFPSRAEGWNLDLIEMMACGKHVIATDYAGHTEFANAANCHLIPTKGLEKASDGIWFHGFGEWAMPDENALISALRNVHNAKQRGFLYPNLAGIETSKTFSWAATAATIITELPL